MAYQLFDADGVSSGYPTVSPDGPLLVFHARNTPYPPLSTSGKHQQARSVSMKNSTREKRTKILCTSHARHTALIYAYHLHLECSHIYFRREMLSIPRKRRSLLKGAVSPPLCRSSRVTSDDTVFSAIYRLAIYFCNHEPDIPTEHRSFFFAIIIIIFIGEILVFCRRIFFLLARFSLVIINFN